MKQSVLNKLKQILIKKDKSAIQCSEAYEWLKEDYSREETEMFLHNKDTGVFVVRKSESIINCFVLSVKVPKYVNSTQIAHYLIDYKKKNVYKLRGSSLKFDSLATLIGHCALARDLLPIILNLNHYQHKQEIVYQLSRQANTNDEFLYYSSGSSIASSAFSLNTCSSASSLPNSIN